MDYRKHYFETLLPAVEKPAQYVGGEWNSIRQVPPGAVRFALAFPDTYAIGMSHLGLFVLYEIINSLPFASAERVFCPWLDMIARMRKDNIPLLTLETFTPLNRFDVIGFSLQYEMTYTNVLAMLELGGIELLAQDRPREAPLVVGGGPCAANPEPLADFFDLFVLGDGEEAVVELARAVHEAKQASFADRGEFIKYVAKRVPGAYAPRFYAPRHDPLGKPQTVECRDNELPSLITAARMESLEKARPSLAPVVPLVQAVHERIMVEIMRGCTRGCRFCQAGMIKRPRRTRSIESIISIAEALYSATGYDEISLLSLSTGDYPGIVELASKLSARFKDRGVSLSLPSLRADKVLKDLAAPLASVRKSGLTVAPEAGTDRLRSVINKNISDADLIEGVQSAYRNGWDLIKLYFMVGLPTETDEDIDAIADLARRVSEARRPICGNSARVNIAVSTFVPKPHTPFQWEAAASIEAVYAIQKRLRTSREARRLQWKFHKPERSYLEALLARGDRTLGKLLLECHRLGICFDSWDECFNYSLWLQAIENANINPAPFTTGPFNLESPLPWDHISMGLEKDFLAQERHKAYKASITQDCSSNSCQNCGIHCKDTLHP